MKRAFTALLLSLAAAAGLAAADVQAGVDQYLTGRYDEAVESLREAVVAQPEDETGRLYLTLALAEQQKLDEARSEHQAMVSEGASAVALNIAEARLAIAAKDTGKALTLLNEAVDEAPDNAQARHLRGMVYTYQKDYPKAVEDFEAALEGNPKIAYAHYYAGMAYNGMKRPDKMVEHFQQFLQMAPDAPEAPKVQSFLRAFR